MYRYIVYISQVKYTHKLGFSNSSQCMVTLELIILITDIIFACCSYYVKGVFSESIMRKHSPAVLLKEFPSLFLYCDTRTVLFLRCVHERPREWIPLNGHPYLTGRLLGATLGTAQVKMCPKWHNQAFPLWIQGSECLGEAGVTERKGLDMIESDPRGRSYNLILNEMKFQFAYCST